MDTSFQRVEDGKNEWLTPPEIITALGEFDLDPCSPINRPWPTAKKHYTIEDDGLISPWEGRVWCNPPYGNQTGIWMNKCAEHGNAIALIFSRTDTKDFHRYIFRKADALFFFEGRLSFYHVTGQKGGSAGCGSVLVAYGKENAECLKNAKLKGIFLQLK